MHRSDRLRNGMMRMTLRKLATGLLVFGLSALASLGTDARENVGTSETVPVPALAGASEADAARQLGQASRCEPSKYGRKCFFKGEAVEIMFIDGAADWFTVTPQSAAYSPSSLDRLGLPRGQTPAFSSDQVMRWSGLGGVREVSVFPDGKGGVRYFYIKAKTQ